jgi:3-oxoacyl-[acyl-carrier-protein] synthase-3
VPRFSRIIGTGGYLPAHAMTNHELATVVETSDEWIRAMTGIARRHIAGDGETTAEMAALASEQALQAAAVPARDLDLIIVATITPDRVFPSTAALLQARLGARQIGAFDVSAACSGFLYALASADAMIASGRCACALVVGAERMSTLLDWSDRATCVLFGDGAGAVVLTASDSPGVRSVDLHADGSTPGVLYAGGESAERYVRMQGPAVFRFAVDAFVEGAAEAMQRNEASIGSVDWIVPHQANQRIIDLAAKRLGVANERMVVTVADHGNTSAASLPLALDTAVRDGRIRSGHHVLLLSVGGGFTWASSLVEW